MTEPSADSAAVDVGGYCREVEAFLCRRNGGHLIRLVGPAFAMVSGWATEGIPLRVTLNGIERTIVRHEARAARRRPVRVEFCEADVLDAFDEWRRAVGPHATRASQAAPAPASSGEASPARRQPSLPRHIERSMERLSSVRASSELPTAAGDAVDAALRALDAVLDGARGARGGARQDAHAALSRIDDTLMAQLVDALPDKVAQLAARAQEELRPLRPRLAEAAYRDATARVLRHLLRQDLGLPEIVLP